MTNRKISILIIGIILAIAIISTLLYHKKSPVSEENGTSSLALPNNISVKSIQNEKGWAYEIWIENQLFIYQESIPGLPNNVPFQTEQDAFKCGALVVSKMKKKQIPSITRTELDSLGVKY